MKIKSIWDQSYKQIKRGNHNTKRRNGLDLRTNNAKSKKVPIGDGQGNLLWC